MALEAILEMSDLVQSERFTPRVAVLRRPFEIRILSATMDQATTHLLPLFQDVCNALGIKLRRTSENELLWEEFNLKLTFLSTERAAGVRTRAHKTFVDHYAREER